jgi:putative addiction module component (TIGR02574 family)
MSQSSLPPEIRQLPLAERVQLVEQIWNSIAEDEKQFQLTAAQQVELDKRLLAQQDDPNRSAPWEEVKKRLRGN